MEIISIGNELLIGKVQNTNSTWLAQRVTALGITVRRITVVGDYIDDIANIIREVLQRNPQFLLITGGLGPTYDDKTSKGIAKALKKKLIVNKKALNMVKKRYELYLKEGKIGTVELTKSRVKMATFPERAEPLKNPVGTAPGIMIKAGATLLLAIPGVPKEMQEMFKEKIEPLLKKASEGFTFFETSIYVDGIMESSMAPLIKKVADENPSVYIKSHPKCEGERANIEIHFSTTAKDSKTAKSCIGRAIIQLSELIQKNSGKITNKKQF
jgi:molybdenum cofactor synthesis domain-containing protein